MSVHSEKISSYWKDSPWYDRADQCLPYFWNQTSIFQIKFKHLNLEKVVELACGHGRHVPQYINNANQIILMDVNQENIDFCRDRFGENPKISYYKNSGSDFSQLSDSSVTSIFTYDAMVHFEVFDVYSYIKDAFRVLVPGGRILFHHSNNDAYPTRLWNENPHSRNFMSANLFSYFANRTGFKILSQDIMDWGSGEDRELNIDCLTLCEKPS